MTTGVQGHGQACDWRRIQGVASSWPLAVPSPASLAPVSRKTTLFHELGLGDGFGMIPCSLTVIVPFISHLIPPLMSQEVPICSPETGDPRLRGQDLTAVQSQGSGGDMVSAAASPRALGALQASREPGRMSLVSFNTTHGVAHASVGLPVLKLLIY